MPDDQHIVRGGTSADPPITMQMAEDQVRLPMLRPQTMAMPPMPFEHMRQLAESIAKSGMFGIKTADQALVLMSIAQAEGRHPALAARDYDIINGKPSKKAEAMMRDFLSGGGRVEWLKLEDTVAEAAFSHPVGGDVTIRWDTDRVRRAGLGSNGMYTKYPRQMLRSRVVSEGVRTVWPMATSGMYVPEEVAAQPDQPDRQIDAPRPSGTKLEQFEQRHTTVDHDPETGEVAEPALNPVEQGELAELIALGDAAVEGGAKEFARFWNDGATKLYRKELRPRLKDWQVLATAADERGAADNAERQRFLATEAGIDVDEEPQGSPPAHATPPEATIAAPPLPGAQAASPGPLSRAAVPAASSRTPDAPAGSTAPASTEIPPVYGNKGELLWATWVRGLFLPKLKQQQTADQLAALIHDNALHMEAAEAALGVEWPDAAITAAWQRVGR